MEITHSKIRRILAKEIRASRKQFTELCDADPCNRAGRNLWATMYTCRIQSALDFALHCGALQANEYRSYEVLNDWRRKTFA